MTSKELKHLRRGELLELLVAQGKRINELEQELEAAHQELERREIAVQSSGTMAEAALRLNGVFEAIDAAAEQYMENLKMRLQDGEER